MDTGNECSLYKTISVIHKRYYPKKYTRMCALTECTNTISCIWPDDDSMSRNMSPNF
jgi:hypothetical protein